MVRRSTFVLLALALLTAGCSSSGPKTTALTQDDMDITINQFAAKLAASDFLTSRDANSPPIIISINKAENRSSDVIPTAEQWMIMYRIKSSIPVMDLKRTRNISFQLPPERQAELRKAGNIPDEPASVMPTHTMSATFFSSTRVARNKEGYVNDRADLYYIRCKIVDLRTREEVWDDSVDLKRQAKGMLID
ncbi:MAG: hypothetical protein GC164_10025 [Phycisphaera sp.]|nr:hypothetical protein [Phycisphaera sp.]